MWFKKLSITLLLGFLLLFTHTLISFSDGPPPARTGAPGELTCRNGYCHNSYQLNSGPGTATLVSNIPETGYVPGEKYLITPSIKHSDQQRFGFMSLAYSPKLQASIGEIKLSEPERTQIKFNDPQDRSYVTHDTAWAASDSAQWTYEWIAPQNGEGDISFYAAFVAADFSENASGDYVYTTSLTVNQDTLNTKNWEPLPAEYLNIIAANGKIRLQWNLPHSENAVTSVMALNGQLIHHSKSQLPAMSYQQELSLNGQAAGIYLIHIQLGKWIYSQKVAYLE